MNQQYHWAESQRRCFNETDSGDCCSESTSAPEGSQGIAASENAADCSSCCMPFNSASSGDSDPQVPPVITSHPNMMETGVQTVSFQDLQSDFEAQHYALEAQRTSSSHPEYPECFEYPEAFLEDLRNIRKSELDGRPAAVEMSVQTSCSLEDLLNQVEAQRDALEVHRDHLEQTNAFLEDRLLFMESQLNLLMNAIDHGSTHAVHVNEKVSAELMLATYTGSGNVMQEDCMFHGSNGEHYVDPFLVRGPQERRDSSLMGNTGSSFTTMSWASSQLQSLSSISTVDSSSHIIRSDRCIKSMGSLELDSSEGEFWCGALTSKLPFLWGFPGQQGSSLPQEKIAAPDKLFELPAASCLWFSLKSNDAVVGYACGSVSTERNKVADELGNDQSFRRIASNVMPYTKLRREAALQRRQQDLLQEIPCKAWGNLADIVSERLDGAPSFELKTRNIAPGAVRHQCQTETLSIVIPETAEELRPSSGEILSSALRLPGPRCRLGGQSLLPVQSLSKASAIWGKSSASR